MLPNGTMRQLLRHLLNPIPTSPSPSNASEAGSGTAVATRVIGTKAAAPFPPGGQVSSSAKVKDPGPAHWQILITSPGIIKPSPPSSSAPSFAVAAAPV